MSNPTFRLVDGNGKVTSCEKSRLVSFAISAPSTVSIVLFQRSMGQMFSTKTFTLCEDDSVIGTAYIMARARARFPGPDAPRVNAGRAPCCVRFNERIAR